MLGATSLTLPTKSSCSSTCFACHRPHSAGEHGSCDRPFGGCPPGGVESVCLPDALLGHDLAWRSCPAPLTVKWVTSRCFPLSCHLQVLSWTRGFGPTSTPGMGASPRCGRPSAAAFARASATLLYALPMCSMSKDTPRPRSRRRAACTSAGRGLMLVFRMYDVPRASSTTSVESPRILSLHPSGSTFPSITSCSKPTRPDHMARNSAWLLVEPRGRRKDVVLMSVLVAVSMMTNPDPPCLCRCRGRCESAPWPGAAPSNCNSRLRAVMRWRRGVSSGEVDSSGVGGGGGDGNGSSSPCIGTGGRVSSTSWIPSPSIPQPTAGPNGAGGFSVGSAAVVERVGARGTSTGEVLRTGAGFTVFCPAGVGVSGWRSRGDGRVFCGRRRKWMEGCQRAHGRSGDYEGEPRRNLGDQVGRLVPRCDIEVLA